MWFIIKFIIFLHLKLSNSYKTLLKVIYWFLNLVRRVIITSKTKRELKDFCTRLSKYSISTLYFNTYTQETYPLKLIFGKILFANIDFWETILTFLSAISNSWSMWSFILGNYFDEFLRIYWIIPMGDNNDSLKIRYQFKFFQKY